MEMAFPCPAAQPALRRNRALHHSPQAAQRVQQMTL